MKTMQLLINVTNPLNGCKLNTIVYNFAKQLINVIIIDF